MACSITRCKSILIGTFVGTTVALGAGLPAAVHATVFYAREELLRLAFPTADQTNARDFFLTDQQRRAIEELAQSRLESDLVTVYEGYARGSPLGYAIIDSHLVRTLTETLLVVLTPDGRVAATHVAAFYEPGEYLPKERWRKQLVGQGLSDQLRVGRSLAAITGSTLSSRAVVSSVRRAMAVYAVLIRGEK